MLEMQVSEILLKGLPGKALSTDSQSTNYSVKEHSPLHVLFLADAGLEKISQGRVWNAEGCLEILSESGHKFCSPFCQEWLEIQRT